MAEWWMNRGLEVEWEWQSRQWKLNEPGYKNQGKETNRMRAWGQGIGSLILLEETEDRKQQDTGQFSSFPSHWCCQQRCLGARTEYLLCLPRRISFRKHIPEG